MPGSHLHTTRNPMSECRRNHIHGRLIGLPERPSLAFYLISRLLVGVLFLVVGTLLAAALPF